MLGNLERSVRGVRMGKSGPLERAELANQIEGFKIPDRCDASEKNKYGLLTKREVKLAGYWPSSFLFAAGVA